MCLAIGVSNQNLKTKDEWGLFGVSGVFFAGWRLKSEIWILLTDAERP